MLRKRITSVALLSGHRSIWRLAGWQGDQTENEQNHPYSSSSKPVPSKYEPLIRLPTDVVRKKGVDLLHDPIYNKVSRHSGALSIHYYIHALSISIYFGPTQLT